MMTRPRDLLRAGVLVSTLCMPWPLAAASPPLWRVVAERAYAGHGDAGPRSELDEIEGMIKKLGRADRKAVTAKLNEMAACPTSAEGLRAAAALLRGARLPGDDPMWAGSGLPPWRQALLSGGDSVLVGLAAKACEAGQPEEVRLERAKEIMRTAARMPLYVPPPRADATVTRSRLRMAVLDCFPPGPQQSAVAREAERWPLMKDPEGAAP